MKAQDTLWLALKGISERKVRTGLTVLTVMIGVAAIVALVSLVAGFSVSINKSLESIGPTAIYVVPHPSHIFTGSDIAVIASLPNVSSVVPLLTANANVTVGNEHVPATLIGVSNYSINDVAGNLTLMQGSFFNDSSTSTALVGYSVAYPNGTGTLSPLTLDEPVYMTLTSKGGKRGATLVTTGVLSKYGSSFFISPDTSIFMPLPAAENLLETYSYSEIIVKASNASTVNSVYNLLSTIYGNSATILSVQQIAATVSSILGSIGLLLGSIAGVSLIVAGISILSIMMVSVTERTREIGILKALGFKKREVLTLFLAEGLIIGVLGGIVGLGVGAAGSYALPGLLSHGPSQSGSQGSPAGQSSSGPRGGAVAAGGGGAGGGPSGSSSSASSSSSGLSSSSITPVVTLQVAIEAILIAVIVSVFASLYPAWKASNVDPITALRTE